MLRTARGCGEKRVGMSGGATLPSNIHHHPPSCLPFLCPAPLNNNHILFMPEPALKRKRTTGDVVSLQEEPVDQLPDRFHPSFNEPQADVILRTKDGMLFGLRRAVLIGSSEVFDMVFDMPQPSATVQANEDRLEVQAAPNSLPVVQMTENALQVQTYLSWIHQGTFPAVFKRFESRWRYLEDEADELLWLLDCAVKYDSPCILLPVFHMVREASLGPHPENTVALGIVYDREELVKGGMYAWLMRVSAGGHEAGGRDKEQACVSRIWPALVDRLPKRFFLHIAVAVQNIEKPWGAVLCPDVDRRLKRFMQGYKDGFPTV